MAIADTHWGRLEPGHYTRNLHGFTLDIYRKRMTNSAEYPRRVCDVWRWVAWINSEHAAVGTYKTLREAKSQIEAAAENALAFQDYQRWQQR